MRENNAQCVTTLGHYVLNVGEGEYHFSYLTSDSIGKQKENQEKKEERGCLISNTIVRMGQLRDNEEEEHPRQGEEHMQRPEMGSWVVFLKENRSSTVPAPLCFDWEIFNFQDPYTFLDHPGQKNLS